MVRAWLVVVVLGSCSRHQDPPSAAPPEPTHGTRLFSADVPTGTLPLSIGIETNGGVNSIMFARGTPLPTSHTEMFSTATDDQSRVEIHIVQGERPNVADDRSLGMFQLFGIPPAPRGVPQIDVTFAIDAQGVLDVSARDRATGQSKGIKIDGANSSLTKADIARLLADAAAHAGEDAATKQRQDSRLALESLIYSSAQTLAQAGTKLSSELRDRCTRSLQRARDAIASPTADYAAPADELRTAMHEAAQQLYPTAPR